jgi:hypothetical protein
MTETSEMAVGLSNTVSIAFIVTVIRNAVQVDRRVGRGDEMKNNLYKVIALAVFTMALGGAALAQDYAHKVRADIPFSFYAGTELMPAGSYTFATNLSNHNVEIGQSARGSESFLQGSPNDASKNGLALLTFRTNGTGAYALQKVQGEDFGVSFNAEKVLSHLAANQPAEATRTVIAQLVK